MNNNNIVDFHQAWVNKNAQAFVDVYVKKGKNAAAEWSRNNIPEEKRMLLKPRVIHLLHRLGKLND